MMSLPPKISIFSFNSDSPRLSFFSFFFFNDPAPPEIYPLSLPDALPISECSVHVSEWRHIASQQRRSRFRGGPAWTSLDRSHARAWLLSNEVQAGPPRNRLRRCCEIGRAHV